MKSTGIIRKVDELGRVVLPIELRRTLNIDIKEEQRKAQEHIAEQGLRVLVCAGTGCIAGGSIEIYDRLI